MNESVFVLLVSCTDLWLHRLRCANTDATSQSSTSSVHGNLLQDLFEYFAELPADQKLSKRCKDDDFLRKDEKGQFFITLEERSEVMQTACPEYSFSKPHNIPAEGGFAQIRRSAQSWM